MGEAAEDYLPAAVLARPDFAAACGGRDLGQILQLAKRWGGVGFSSSHLARRCGLTVSRVQDYIHGRVLAQQLGVFERVADGLHIPGAMLDLGTRPWEVGHHEAPARVAPADADADADEAADADADVGTGAASLITTDFLWTPERAGDGYLADVRQCIDSLVTVDNRFGGAEVSRLSEKVFEAVRRRLGLLDYEPSIKSDLAATVGELAEVAGWLAYDAGRQNVVRRMNHESLHFTRLAGDKAMELLTLQNASMHAGFMNQPGEALDIAELVLEGDGYRLTPRLQALFLTRKARALAQVGAEASTGLFDEIRSLFLDGVEVADPPWAWWIDEREIVWHEAMCRKDLGDNRTALDRFERSVEAATTGDRRSDFIHRAYLLGGQVAARSWRSAEGTMDELEQMASDVASPRSVLVIRDALADLRHPGLCAPRHLVDHATAFDATLAGTVVLRGT